MADDPILADTVTALTTLETEQLLASQGDERHFLLSSGTNRYLNRYRPEPVLSFGSCTSSTISEPAFAAAERLHGWLRSIDAGSLPEALEAQYKRVRQEIIGNLAMSRANSTDVVLAPSGTDAEYIPLLVALAGGRRLHNIMVGPAEAGSGSALAAGGHYFSGTTPGRVSVTTAEPVNADIAAQVVVTQVDIRDDDGDARPVAEIDAQVAQLARERIAAGEDVLLHLIAHSKTGLHAPSVEMVNQLTAENPGRVLAVVDAAQGRLSRRGLGESLERGWITLVTGSKFFGGPPFAGAVLVPHTLWHTRQRPALPEGFGAYFSRSMFPSTWVAARETAPAAPNVGLLLRWWAALAEIRDYYSVPATLRLGVLQSFQALVPALLREHPEFVEDVVAPPLDHTAEMRLLESNTTVFAFTCQGADGHPLNNAVLQEARRRLRGIDTEHSLRAEIGQPVDLGVEGSGRTILRVALGARNIIRTSTMSSAGQTFDGRIKALESAVRTVLAELARCVREAEVSLSATLSAPR